MSTWLNRGPPAAPAASWKKERPTLSRSDSHQPASTKAGAVQYWTCGDNFRTGLVGIGAQQDRCPSACRDRSALRYSLHRRRK